MDFELSPVSRSVRDRAENFFQASILPRHRAWHQAVVREGRFAPFMPRLQDEARAAGLWNLGLPLLRDDEPGTRLSNLEFAPVAEILGRLPWASQVFNCQAPDVPNMAMMQALATPDQRARWLNPLLDGTIRSAYAMTEPDTASSDATNIATRIEFGTGPDAGMITLNGRKWFATGGAHPDCAFLIVMGVSDPDAPRTERQSMVIVPIDTPGLVLERELSFMGWRDHVAPIGEFTLRDVKVPVANLLGERGQGFRGAQVRLGPARIHHCMRCIGMAEMLLAQMIARARERSTFGRSVIDYDTIQGWIAEARVEIEMVRLFIHKAAAMVDQSGGQGGGRDVWRQVSMIKIATPRMLQTIADRAVQVFGAMGGVEETLIHHAWAYARWFRIGDGPDEVHLRQIFRTEPTPDWSIADCPYIAPPVFASESAQIGAAQ
ncbi:MAG: acyl-CoA dehydrogenase family protein [Pararhodobacter sp.]|nr:acyl-CoA dehydrogenase family protein [Pararhodobacter sp.]